MSGAAEGALRDVKAKAETSDAGWDDREEELSV
jgi:hypothetical protein